MRVTSLRALAVGVMVALVVPLGPSAGAIKIGEGDGCTPGFWKNHTRSWQEYTPSTTLGSQFTFPAELSSLESATFIEALRWGGGPTIEDAARNLLKHAVTGFLNAAHDDLAYPFRRDGTGVGGRRPLRQLVNEALASLDRDTMLELKDTLDRVNNGDCRAGGKNTNAKKKRKAKKANRR
jgi:hypothetical protein